jgi:hypothetical protein
MAISGYSIGRYSIGGYLIHGYWWLFNSWLLVVI